MANITCNDNGIPPNTNVAKHSSVTFSNGGQVERSEWSWPNDTFTDGSTGVALPGKNQTSGVYTTREADYTRTINVVYSTKDEGSSGNIKVGGGGF